MITPKPGVHETGSSPRERVTSTGALTITYQHTDALGTPVVITGSNRGIVEQREYEPYGYQLTPALQDGVNYTGHVADAGTGLVYMQQRYYDPGIGRFLSRDPVTADLNTGANFNAYWYANNNPYRFTDPDGRQPRRGEMDLCDTPGLCGTSDGAAIQESMGRDGGSGAESRSVTEQAKAQGRSMTDPYVNPDWKDEHYEIATPICPSGPGCTPGAVADVGDYESVPFHTGPAEGRIAIWGNPIFHFRRGNVFINITDFGHRYHSGGVLHATFDFSDYVWLYTRGVGGGAHRQENALAGQLLFGKMHQDVWTFFNPTTPVP